jgi:signal peptidase II
MRGARAQGWRRALIAAAAVVIVDQATKALVIANIALGDKDPIFPGVDLTYVRNSGVAFGAFAGGGPLVWGLTILALSGLLIYFAFRSETPWLWLPVGAIAGGALGNLADRAREGAVIDFIDVVAWPAFNVADMAIVCGILAFVYVAEGEKDGGPRTAAGAGSRTADGG